MFFCSNLSEASITASSYLSLMAVETLGILKKLQYPVSWPRNHQQPKVPQFWAALSQHSHHAVSDPYSLLTGVNGRKTHQSGQLLTKNTQSEIKIRYYLEICPVLGQKRSSSASSQLALSLEEGGQGKAALPALPKACSEEAPALLPVLVTRSDSDMSIPCPHPDLPLWVFF